MQVECTDQMLSLLHRGVEFTVIAASQKQAEYPAVVDIVDTPQTKLELLLTLQSTGISLIYQTSSNQPSSSLTVAYSKRLSVKIASTMTTKDFVYFW